MGSAMVWPKVSRLSGVRYPNNWKQILPEEQTEYGEGADVDAASGDGREDAAGEAGHDQDQGLPDPEVLDGVVRDSLVLSD